jgi:hypothetical protein
LTTARLLDPPQFRSKEITLDNISYQFVLNKIGNKSLKTWMNDQLHEQNLFFENIKLLRNKFLAHNDTEFDEKPIQAGTEIFYARMHEFIVKIKQKHDPTIVWDENTLISIEKETKIGVHNIFCHPRVGRDPDPSN